MAEERCPWCGRAGIPIVYGYPDEELIEASERGEVAIGGCCITDDDPAFECAAGHRWGLSPRSEDLGLR